MSRECFIITEEWPLFWYPAPLKDEMIVIGAFSALSLSGLRISVLMDTRQRRKRDLVSVFLPPFGLYDALIYVSEVCASALCKILRNVAANVR
jgi:hypothetical protein